MSNFYKEFVATLLVVVTFFIIVFSLMGVVRKYKFDVHADPRDYQIKVYKDSCVIFDGDRRVTSWRNRADSVKTVNIPGYDSLLYLKYRHHE